MINNKAHYLYLITREDGEQYIGVTSNIQKRMYSHKYGTGNKYLAGREFTYKILCEGSQEYIYSIEELSIQKYKCSLNVAKGGNSGPQLKGESHGNALLSTKDVLEIKGRLSSTKDTYDNIAKDYGVSKSTISNIANNNTWTSVGEGILSTRKINKIAADTKNKIIELWNSGIPRSEIVKTLSVSKTSVYDITKSIIPVVPTRHANSLSTETIDKILSKHFEGFNCLVIAKDLGLSKTTVQKYLIQKGVKC